MSNGRAIKAARIGMQPNKRRPRGKWRVRFLYVAALVFLVLGRRVAGFGSQIEKLSDGKVRPSSVAGLRVAYLPIVFPSSHSSNLLSLRNGDLLCAWYSGQWEGRSGVAIVISRLPKGSGQWTQPVMVAQEAGWAFENPVLFEPPTGPLWLFYTRQAADAGQSKSQMFYRTSSDDGKNWTGPKLLFDRPGSFDRQRLLVVGDQWLLPMYYTPSSGISGKDALSHYSAIQISGDQGRTWKECPIADSNGLVQPDIIERSPRHLIAFFRSRFADWVYTSSSEDGCSWTTPRPTQIPNNNSSIQVVRLRDGHMAIAFNNIQATTERGKPQTGPRWPLSVALSVDGGQTWPWVRDLDIGQEVPQEPIPSVMAGTDITDNKGAFFGHLFSYEYPSIIETADGTIHVSYTFRRRTIKYANFDENWIKGGSTLGIFTGDQNPSK
jgi:predicted neuraminidase